MIKRPKYDDFLLTDLRKTVNAAPVGESGCEDFCGDVEQALGFAHFPVKLKSHIHQMAYDRGHSSGCSEILSEYFDILDTVSATMESFGI